MDDQDDQDDQDGQDGRAHEIIDRWTWFRDDQHSVPSLLALPCTPGIAEGVLVMCIRNNSLTASTAALLSKYSHCVRDVPRPLRARVVRLCTMALRYLPEHAYTVLDAIDQLDHPDQGLLDQCIACFHPRFPLNVRRMAMAVVARMSSPLLVDGALVLSFPHVKDMVTKYDEVAPALMSRIAHADSDYRDYAIQACIAAGNYTRPAVDLVYQVVDRGGVNYAIAIGGMELILKAGNELPGRVMKLITTNRDVTCRDDLLVYLVKYGVVPYGAHEIWAHVLRDCTVQTKSLYVRYLDTVAAAQPAEAPALKPLNEAHVGCISIVTSGGQSVTMLLCMLARHADVFDRAHAWGQSDTFTVLAEEHTVLALRDHVYYFDTARTDDYSAEDARELAVLADMIGARAILDRAMYRLAVYDFWQAYDMMNEWGYVGSMIRQAAIEQLGTLVRCSRMAEIASMVAGDL